MREIKFRVWNKLEKKMLIFEDGQGLALTFYSDGSRLLTQDLGEDIINDFEVMQYTGLKDRNSVEIYESDICKSGNGRLWIIKHGYFISSHPVGSCEGYGWYAEPIEEELKTAGNCFLYDGFTIIGNIYENPDLIKNYPEK